MLKCNSYDIIGAKIHLLKCNNNIYEAKMKNKETDLFTKMCWNGIIQHFSDIWDITSNPK